MRNKKVKVLRRIYKELNENVQYNIKGQIVSGKTFRNFKKQYAK